MRLTSKEQEELVLKNIGLVGSIAKKYLKSYNDFDELVSIGRIGLIKAAITFDISKGAKFSTYSGRCIENEIRMSLRKLKGYENEVSLEDAINTDMDGNELTFADKIPGCDGNFSEEIIRNEPFEKLISIILNLLKGRDRLIMLYQIAGINQNFIAKTFNISQSYISRLETRLNDQVKSYLTNNQQYEEVFKMSVVGDFYKISFLSKDIKQFNQIFATFLQNLKTTKDLPDFKVSCNKERILILVPAHPESFSFIAQIIKEIDDYTFKFESDKNVLSVDDNIHQKGKLDEDKENQSVAAIKEAIVVESAEKRNEGEEVDKKSPTALNGGRRKNSQVTKVREYFLTKDTFTVKELKEKFPDLHSSTIPNALMLAKNKGLITLIGRGEYAVVKK